jgi:DNA-3-methyladenine glycosylase II
MTTFTIEPDAPFSLAAASSFGFGPNTGRPTPSDAEMRLAFVTDDLRHHAAVQLTQTQAGVVVGTVQGEVDVNTVKRQVSRILSLDHSGREWLVVGERDPVVGRLQERHAGLRPVLFHSPYEAAAWSIIATRRMRTQAAALRTRLASHHGGAFAVAGEELYAFPLPEELLGLDAFPGLDSTRLERLQAVARAALEGQLEPELLVAMEPAQALEQLRRLPGIGPTYATLILLRATGVTDVLTLSEPRLPSYVAHLYQTRPVPATAEQIAALAEGWRPFRSWAAVLIRVAGDRLKLPIVDGG